VTPATQGDGTRLAGDLYVKRVVTIGKSRRDRPIRAWYRGDRRADHVLVLLGQMHGDEKAGPRTARWVRSNLKPRRGTGLWIIPTMNPDGDRRGTRKNARGVDLNRNWPTSGWTRSTRSDRYYGGPRPASEPETRAMIRFLKQVRPDYVASIHQPLHAVGKGGGDLPWQRRLARNLALPLRHLGVGNPAGTVSPTMTGWYNARYRGVATTIEYGAGPSARYVTRKAGRGICRAARILR
jgi:predicted deacylase